MTGRPEGSPRSSQLTAKQFSHQADDVIGCAAVLIKIEKPGKAFERSRRGRRDIGLLFGEGAHRHRGNYGKHLLDEGVADASAAGDVLCQGAADVFAAQEVAQDAIAVGDRAGIGEGGWIVDVAAVIPVCQCAEEAFEAALLSCVAGETLRQGRKQLADHGAGLIAGKAKLARESFDILAAVGGLENVHEIHVAKNSTSVLGWS